MIPQIEKLKENLRIAKLDLDHKHRIEFEQRGTFQGAKLIENKASKFWEYFLLTAKDVNGNGWGVSPDTIDSNIKDFIGQPFVITAKSWIPNSEYGTEYTHPYIPTNHIPTIFAHQNKFAVGIIREVIKKGDDYSAMVEPFPKYASMNPPPFCSPGIFQTNRSEPEGNIRSWRALHLAGLDAEPAYGARVAMFKGSCVGTKEECKVSFHGAKLVSGIECPILFSRFQRIAEFNESDHPRKEDGEFTCKGCGEKYNQNDREQHIKTHKSKNDFTPILAKNKYFETGKPVDFKFMRNTEKAGYYGSTYGQDIEPKGQFMLRKDTDTPLQNTTWIEGKNHFDNPLVIRHENTIQWKKDLQEITGKKGLALSRHLKKLGYDGIVTITDNGNDSEIVDLKPVQ